MGYIYAGIDEAGYGPKLGPMVIGCSAFSMPQTWNPNMGPPSLWDLLSAGICKGKKDRKGRVPVNDSKQLYTPATGLTLLERSTLAMCSMRLGVPPTLLHWLEAIDHGAGQGPTPMLPWYACDEHSPWAALPAAGDPALLNISCRLVERALRDTGVNVVDTACHVIYEDQLNAMLAAIRSKASVSFTFVTRHIERLWRTYGRDQPEKPGQAVCITIDRQGGRTHYREPLSLSFPEASMTVLDETPDFSSYRMAQPGWASLYLRFEVKGDDRHLPIALASMISKYTRELLMARWNAYFARYVPGIKPTAGYASDATRFLDDLRPHWRDVPCDLRQLVRRG